MAPVDVGDIVWISFVATVGIQLFFFFIAFTLQIDKLTDISGSMNFVLLAVLSLTLADRYSDRQVVATVLVCVWAFRLGFFLLSRVLRRGHDARFDEMRSRFWSFLGFWIFQMLWVFIVSLPVIFLNAYRGPAPSLHWRDYLGWALWAAGFALEVAADVSKDAHYNDPATRGTLLRTGVWAYSRHPNYAGEILLWTGITITSSAVFGSSGPGGTDYAYFALVSVPFLSFLLLLVSGVPLAEDRADRRFSGDPAYEHYKESTPPVMPFPPFLYSRLPEALRQIFCCEFPLYWRSYRKGGRSPPPADSDAGAGGGAGGGKGRSRREGGTRVSAAPGDDHEDEEH